MMMSYLSRRNPDYDLRQRLRHLAHERRPFASSLFLLNYRSAKLLIASGGAGTSQ
jgi:hypothetical protein